MPTVYHMVHYRRFSSQSSIAPGVKLETLLRQVLHKVDGAGETLWNRASDRIFGIHNEPGRQILLNKAADLSSAIFGEMCLIDQKGLQTLLGLTKSKAQLSALTSAEIFALQEAQAPSGSQFIRGMAYWVVIGDHLFFVKTQSMSADNIREYLEWLLKLNGGGLGPSCSISLQAEFDKSQIGGDIGDIQGLRMKGKSSSALLMKPTIDAKSGPKQVATSRKIGDRFAEFAQAVPIVTALFGSDKTESLVNSLGPEEYLAVEATVKVRGKRTEESRAQMRELANEVADMTDGEVRIEGKDGQVSDGDAILRTRMPFHVGHEGASLLEFSNVADQLQEVYSRFVQDGKISA